MKAQVIEIEWHERNKSIFSVDISKEGLVATGGQDSRVSLWRVAAGDGAIAPQRGGPAVGGKWGKRQRVMAAAAASAKQVTFVEALEGHAAAVSVVRFDPARSHRLASGADDGYAILWEYDSAQGKWRLEATLHEHNDMIMDVAWSADGRHLATASVDNTVAVWDMSESSRPRRVASLREHTNYVQGVAWDPLGKYLCSLGADRTLRMYEWTRGGRRLVPCGCVSNHALERREEPDEAEDGTGAAGRDQTVATKSKPAPALRWFAGQGILHFFRRLAWSPDGQVLACPASLAYATDNSSSEKEDIAMVLKSRCHAVHVFARRHLHMPWGHLDGHGEPVIAVRFCPRRYHPVPMAEGRTTGEAFPPRTDRLVLAVATQTQVFLYDTQHPHPIARCAGLHLAHLTDMAWAPDASYLLVASLDGYLSKIRFDRENELGAETETAEAEGMPDSAIPSS